VDRHFRDESNERISKLPYMIQVLFKIAALFLRSGLNSVRLYVLIKEILRTVLTVPRVLCMGFTIQILNFSCAALEAELAQSKTDRNYSEAQDYSFRTAPSNTSAF